MTYCANLLWYMSQCLVTVGILCGNIIHKCCRIEFLNAYLALFEKHYLICDVTPSNLYSIKHDRFVYMVLRGKKSIGKKHFSSQIQNVIRICIRLTLY